MSSNEKDRRRSRKPNTPLSNKNESRKSSHASRFDAVNNAMSRGDGAIHPRRYDNGSFNTDLQDPYSEGDSLPGADHHQMTLASNIGPEDGQWSAPLPGPSTHLTSQPLLSGPGPASAFNHPLVHDLGYPHQGGSPSSVAVNYGSAESSPRIQTDRVRPNLSYQTPDTGAHHEKRKRTKRKGSQGIHNNDTVRKRANLRDHTEDFVQHLQRTRLDSQTRNVNSHNAFLGNVEGALDGDEIPVGFWNSGTSHYNQTSQDGYGIPNDVHETVAAENDSSLNLH